MKAHWWKSLQACGLLLLLAWSGCQPGRDDSSAAKRQPTDQQPTNADAQQAFRQGNFDEALRICVGLLSEQPASVPLLMLAGESATKLEKFAEALDYYRQVPDTAGPPAAVARWAAGEIQYHLGQPSACIDLLQASLRINSGLLDAHERLAWMLGVCGRRSEMLPHLMALIRGDRTSLQTLLDLGNPWTEYQDWSAIEGFRKSAPGDLLPNLVFAKKHQLQGEVQQAEALLLALLKQQPELLAAHAQLGRLWLSTAPQKLPAWNADLPTAANEFAEIWSVRGEWLIALGRPTEAIHCFWQTLRRDPNHPRACTSLAKVLNQLGDVSSIDGLQQRSTAIQQLHQTVDRIRRTSNYEPTIRQAAELTFRLGRYWESIGWCQYGLRLNSQATWHTSLLGDIQRLGVLNASLPTTLLSPELNSIVESLSSYPPPVYPSPEAVETVAERPAVGQSSPEHDLSLIRFDDIAAQAGVDFVYHNSFVDRAAGKRMFEFTGAGAGVLDYDRDGQPDLFLAQGTPWPIPTTGPVPSDTLYRNLGSRSNGTVKLANTTRMAMIEERQFGQGVCVADIDGDGFDDVYVANFGQNQLWLNQGDGTFQQANSLFSQSSDYWTVSAVAADLDGNGRVEIYDVNYVMGEAVTTLRCLIGGQPRVCPPLVFSPATQQVWVTTEHGTFELYDWAPNQPLACNGLGAVAFLPTREELPRLFVAVDQQANLLLRVRHQPSQRYGFTLEDEALLTGIAFDQSGQAQACMGVAAGDIDQNGEVDLLVTNFYDESNTLYLQQDGVFSDATLKTGLVGPSRPRLGFGAQFLDADADGDLDLVVLNGHIDDHSHLGVAEKMRPQFFLNIGHAQFEELPAQRAGEFFDIAGLGRGLATADLNGDGRLDLVATDLEAPLAILENHSERLGEYLAVELVGVQSDRNAFFTQVRVSADGFQSTQQLTAGSGYLVSNQRLLLFSLPTGIKQVEVAIDWPSGAVDRLENVAVNQRLTFVEGQAGTVH